MNNNIMPEMDKQTQRAIIVSMLKQDGCVQNDICIKRGIWRLAAHIHELRLEGWELETDYLVKANGKKGRTCIYKLITK
jgi:hypothetical protein